MAEETKGVGHPMVFSEEEFYAHVLTYMSDIYEGQVNGARDMPTFYGFYKYVNNVKPCSYHTIRRCFDEYWAYIKKEFEDMRGDLVARGASLGVYNSTMAIFALKNWCNWKDKQEIEQDITAKGIEVNINVID
jgi:hypothetical protein